MAAVFPVFPFIKFPDSPCCAGQFAMPPMRLTQESKVKVVSILSCVATAIFMLGASDIGDGGSGNHVKALLLVNNHLLKLQRLLLLQNPEKLQFPRRPTVVLPNSDTYDMLVHIPDRFQNECGCSPSEFAELLAAVMAVLLLCRDPYNKHGVHNPRRRYRRFKYSARERLFVFLCYFRQYGTIRHTQVKERWYGLAADIKWLRRKLVTHPWLLATLEWGSPAAREAERQFHVDAGACSQPTPTLYDPRLGQPAHCAHSLQTPLPALRVS